MRNEELKTNYGVIGNRNTKKKKKMKMIKNGIVILSSAAIVLISGLFIAKQIEKKQINDIPQDQVQTIITLPLESGDTLSEIVERFYSDDCNGVYRYISNYEEAIREENKLYTDNLTAGHEIKVPVIVEKNNEYYQNILKLKDEIQNIEQNNLWVRHTIQGGESLSYLASLASSSISETYEILEQISSKNNIGSKTLLRDGITIWIMNPELGKLKSELSEAQAQFIEYLSVDQAKK